MIIKLPNGTRVNTDNIAYIEEFEGFPPGMTPDEATSEGMAWPVSRVVFCAPEGEYGPLKIDLAHDQRRSFLHQLDNRAT